MDAQGATRELSPTLKRPQEQTELEDPSSAKRVKVASEATMEVNIAEAQHSGEELPKESSEPAQDAPKPSTGDLKSKGKKKEKTADRRGRRGTRNAETERPRDPDTPKEPRLPKRQCALLMGFCGAGYNGMQIQTEQGIKTIEGVLFNALVKIGAVSKDNADNPTKVNLGRAARTDAGVHAAGNLVSMKVITAIPGVDDFVGRVNEELPPEIRLWGVVRAQNSFNARTSCDSRKYTYYFPSYLMIPPKPGSGLSEALRRNGSEVPSHPFWTELEADSTPENDLRAKRAFRVTPEQVQALRETAKKFEGTHNFHNFTVGRDFSDRSTQRHMKRIDIADPVVYGDTEWISVLFHGQSFMLHQRKMMSALVLTCRTGTPPQIIEELYGPRMVFIPKMPALGLLLEYPIFDTYNRRIAIVNEKLQPTDDDYRPPIDFEIHREAIDQFKQEHIYTRMRSIEDREAVFDAWIRSIDTYSGNDLLYLNSKAVIPPNAVIKKGERRPDPFRERKRFDSTTFTTGGKDTATVEEQESEEEEEVTLNKAQLADLEG
ncbi:tRNA pseudouridine synthase [Obba rivulosa]|uniref:tRNA pseudouridine synthase n=1 Tax=Obba rivulosa TaxID=1052685 RepID=A0A8E2DVE6_9APHY|nr:tRNA pseudouridine synthase [Obba rivulosa]